MIRIALLLAAWLPLALSAAPLEPPRPSAPETVPLPPASLGAQQMYEQTRSKLVQIRTLFRDTANQTSVGSGFFVSADGLLITNFHVAGQVALRPRDHRAVYVAADGREGALDLLVIDVVNDLAVFRARPPEGAAAPPRPFLEFRDAARPVAQGERLYSLGNPLDIGCAVGRGREKGSVGAGL